MNDYFEKILQAEVYEVAKKTPLEKAHNLSNTLNNEIFLKREDLQDVFSFKIRGAYNKMSKLTNSQLAQGVITSSAGKSWTSAQTSNNHSSARAFQIML